MSAKDILEKCGLTADDVRRISVKYKHTAKLCMADINEAKHANVRLSTDSIMDRCGGTISDLYSAIRTSRDNGGCTTRRGTYRHYKTEDAK